MNQYTHKQRAGKKPAFLCYGKILINVFLLSLLKIAYSFQNIYSKISV